MGVRKNDFNPVFEDIGEQEADALLLLLRFMGHQHEREREKSLSSSQKKKYTRTIFSVGGGRRIDNDHKRLFYPLGPGLASAPDQLLPDHLHTGNLVRSAFLSRANVVKQCIDGSSFRSLGAESKLDVVNIA